jgi:hypothetical protein
LEKKKKRRMKVPFEIRTKRDSGSVFSSFEFNTMGLPSTLKKYLKAKEELWKFKWVSPCKNTIFKRNFFFKKKILLKKKKPQNPSKDHNSGTDPKFQHKPKYHLSKIFISK